MREYTFIIIVSQPVHKPVILYSFCSATKSEATDQPSQGKTELIGIIIHNCVVYTCSSQQSHQFPHLKPAVSLHPVLSTTDHISSITCHYTFAELIIDSYTTTSTSWTHNLQTTSRNVTQES